MYLMLPLRGSHYLRCLVCGLRSIQYSCSCSSRLNVHAISLLDIMSLPEYEPLSPKYANEIAIACSQAATTQAGDQKEPQLSLS